VLDGQQMSVKDLKLDRQFLIVQSQLLLPLDAEASYRD
jgi:hypothetical protein